MLRFNFAEIREPTYKRYIKVDLAFFVIVFIIVFLIINYQTQNLERKIKYTDNKILQLTKEINRLKRLRASERELINLKRELQNKLRVVSNLEKYRHVPKFLYFFGNRENVSNVWLDELKYNRASNIIDIEANTLNIEIIPTFFRKVERDLGIVKLNTIIRKEYINNNLNYKVDYYKFKFNVRLSNGAIN